LKWAPDAAPSDRMSTNSTMACVNAISTMSKFPVPKGSGAVPETARMMNSTRTNVPSTSAA
jgi:hypothetical protein